MLAFLQLAFLIDVLLSHLILLLVFPAMYLLYERDARQSDRGARFGLVCTVATGLVVLLGAVVTSSWWPLHQIALAGFYISAGVFCTVLLDRLSEPRRLPGWWVGISATLALAGTIAAAEEIVRRGIGLFHGQDMILVTPVFTLLSVAVMLKGSYETVTQHHVLGWREHLITNPHRGVARNAWMLPAALACYWVLWLSIVWLGRT